MIDGKFNGIGRAPYKYPVLPKFAGFELSQIIRENWQLCKDRVISQPVFAAHSMHDTTVEIKGVLDFGVFKKIRDYERFKRVRVVFDTIEWDEGVDLDPEFIYANSKPANGQNMSAKSLRPG